MITSSAARYIVTGEIVDPANGSLIVNIKVPQQSTESDVKLAAEAIIAGFNGQLRGMVADRTYHRLLHVDWIGADMNGDGVPEYVPATDRPGAAEPQRVYTLFSSSSNPRLRLDNLSEVERWILSWGAHATAGGR